MLNANSNSEVFHVKAITLGSRSWRFNACDQRSGAKAPFRAPSGKKNPVGGQGGIRISVEYSGQGGIQLTGGGTSRLFHAVHLKRDLTEGRRVTIARRVESAI